MHLAQRALGLARRVGFGKGEGRALSMLGAVQRERGQLPDAFATQLQALQLCRKQLDAEGEAVSLNSLGNISLDLRQYRQALRYYQQSQGIYENLRLPLWVARSYTNIGSCYEKLNVLDSALVAQQRAEGSLDVFQLLEFDAIVEWTEGRNLNKKEIAHLYTVE